MSDPGACTEREITRPVALCTPDGRLNPDAVGWSRRPLHDCALPGVVGTAQAVGLLGRHRPGLRAQRHLRRRRLPRPRRRVVPRLRDRGDGRHARSRPLARRQGDARPRSRAATMRFTRTRPAARRSSRRTAAPDCGPRRARRRRFDRRRARARPPDHESLSVVIPWSDRRFQFTNKDVARPAAGSSRGADRSYDLAEGTSWGTLDFGRGKWPYRTHWNWGAGAGWSSTGDRLGVQLGGKWTDGTGMTENALVRRRPAVEALRGAGVDLRHVRLAAAVDDPHARGRTASTSRSPRSTTSASRLQLGVAVPAVDQCFGDLRGHDRPRRRPAAHGRRALRLGRGSHLALVTTERVRRGRGAPAGA